MNPPYVTDDSERTLQSCESRKGLWEPADRPAGSLGTPHSLSRTFGSPAAAKTGGISSVLSRAQSTTLLLAVCDQPGRGRAPHRTLLFPADKGASCVCQATASSPATKGLFGGADVQFSVLFHGEWRLRAFVSSRVTFCFRSVAGAGRERGAGGREAPDVQRARGEGRGCERPRQNRRL